MKGYCFKRANARARLRVTHFVFCIGSLTETEGESSVFATPLSEIATGQNTTLDNAGLMKFQRQLATRLAAGSFFWIRLVLEALRLSRVWRSPLTFFSIALIVACAAAAWLFWSNLQHLSCRAAITTASANTQAACNEISRKFSAAERDETFSSDKRIAFESALLEIVLDHYEGVEGGFWSQNSGFTAYSFPTYDGTGKKTDLPAAEQTSIEKTIRQSQFRNRLWSETVQGRREAVVTTACPIRNGESVWMMERAPLFESDAFVAAKKNVVYLFASLSTTVGFLLGFVWLVRIRDAKGQATLNDALEKERERASRNERLRVIGEMSAGLAHDFREPLSTLRLKLENAAVAPAERSARAIPLAIDQIDRLDRFVEMMLAFTRPFHLKLEKVDLRNWLDSSFTSMRSKAQTKSINFHFETAVETWTFDPFQLGRAIGNILENAVEFTPSGGHVVLKVSTDRSRLVIDMNDTGPGLSDDLKKVVFKSAKSERVGGTGLGLLLAKEIIEMHGGSIEFVESAAPGTRFRVVIP